MPCESFGHVSLSELSLSDAASFMKQICKFMPENAVREERKNNIYAGSANASSILKAIMSIIHIIHKGVMKSHLRYVPFCKRDCKFGFRMGRCAAAK